MSLNNIKTKKTISDLFKNGYCVINNVLSIKECETIIKNLKKLKKKVSNNKNFFDEASKKGQLIIYAVTSTTVSSSLGGLVKCFFIYVWMR